MMKWPPVNLQIPWSSPGVCLGPEVTQGILSPRELYIVRSTKYFVHRMLALDPHAQALETTIDSRDRCDLPVRSESAVMKQR